MWYLLVPLLTILALAGSSGTLDTIFAAGHAATVGFQDLFVALHEWSGLPWWCTVVLTTVSLRAILTTPLYIYQQRAIARLEVLHPELREWTTAIQYKGRAISRLKGLDADTALAEIQVMDILLLWVLVRVVEPNTI